MKSAKRRALLALWTLGALLAVLVLLRVFVADVYRVESGSMEPTILGGDAWGEWVLVRYESPEALERFDLAVAYKSGEKPVVKRVVGLPGERVQVVGGDLFVGGERLPPAAPRPRPVTLFDDRVHAVADHFTRDGGAWSEDADGRWWAVPGDDSDAGQGVGLLIWRERLDDGYLLPDGSRAEGTRRVGDGTVSCEVTAGPGATVRLELREEGDLFRGEVELREGGATARIVRLFRLEAPDGEALLTSEVLAERGVEPGGATWDFSFANVDNSLALAVGDGPPLVVTYAENRTPSGAPVAPGSTVGAQVALGAAGDARVGFGRIRIARDLHWIPRGDHATLQPLSLGPNEYFLLGDNSAHSRDGRSWGPTSGADLLGRPRRVVWPPSRARSLADARWILGRAAGSGD